VNRGAQKLRELCWPLSRLRAELGTVGLQTTTVSISGWRSGKPSQCPITFDQMPQPTAADFDLDVYKSADKATKWIEQQGGAAAGKAKSYAPVVVLGLGVVVVVVVAVRKSVVAGLV
jgi:hypothetical protein